MKILILEDDPRAMPVIELLRQKHRVDHARSISDLTFFSFYDPGLNAYDKIIIDAAVPKETVIPFDGIKVEYNHIKGLNGCLFLQNNLEQIKKISSRIALRSAYRSKIFEKEQNNWNDEFYLFTKPVR